MADLSLHKSEKLCSVKEIDSLFASRQRGLLAYPLRMVTAVRPGGCGSGARVQFLISVPKKRLRKAVMRVTMRRRIREAYRLNRAFIPQPATEEQSATGINVAFVYVASEPVPYRQVERAMRRLLPALTPPSQPAHGQLE